MEMVRSGAFLYYRRLLCGGSNDRCRGRAKTEVGGFQPLVFPSL